MSAIHNPEETMVSELKVPREEARVYMFLLTGGRMSADDIAAALNLQPDVTEKAVTGLVEKGACIEFGSEYEALNPRFAITNLYRMMCHANKIEVKRNVVVDQLATMLEKAYEDARTK
ncbi:MAG: hypothetical protein ACE5JV_03160 [Nitrososphaerales archaeon]